MKTDNINLLEGEEVIFESDLVVLTNQRLLDSSPQKKKRKTLKEANLRDVATFQKVKGGRESRMKVGLQVGAAGLVVLLLSSVLRFLPSAIETLLFLAGAVAVVVGVHFTVNSWARISPHTTVIFLVPNSGELVVSFPGHDNPEADELLRRYTRARRGL